MESSTRVEFELEAEALNASDVVPVVGAAVDGAPKDPEGEAVAAVVLAVGKLSRETGGEGDGNEK